MAATQKMTLRAPDVAEIIEMDAGEFRHPMLMITCVREAEHLMRCGGPDTSVSRIAARVGVSLRSLEAGFRQWRQCTPTQSLRRIRLDAARRELVAPSESTTVTAVALNNGFFHLARFSAYYRKQFDEKPGQTLRRSRRRQ